MRPELEATYILTAEMDEESFAWLDGLRRRHFPPERNFLSAHLTLFHQLSGDQVNRLSSLEMPRAPVALDFPEIRFLGFGVAFGVNAPNMERLRDEIRRTVGDPISRQDNQRWKPHVTIQNKVPSEQARKLWQTLSEAYSGRTGTTTGLLVWQYLGGPWKLVKRFEFQDSRSAE